MKKLLTPFLILCCLGLGGCGNTDEVQITGQQQNVRSTLNLEDAEVQVEVGEGSLSGQGENLQLTVGGVSQLTVSTDGGTQTVSPDQIDEILSGERVQAVLEVGTDPSTVVSLALFDPVYDSQSGTIRFSAATFDDLPEWYNLEEAVLFSDAPLSFTSAKLFIDASEEGPVVDTSPPSLGGSAFGSQTDTVYYRYQPSTRTEQLENRTLEIRTPLIVSRQNTFTGELKFDFPIDFTELSVSPLGNSLGITLTAAAANIKPPNAVTIVYKLSLAPNAKIGEYFLPAFRVTGPGVTSTIILDVFVVR